MATRETNGYRRMLRCRGARRPVAVSHVGRDQIRGIRKQGQGGSDCGGSGLLTIVVGSRVRRCYLLTMPCGMVPDRRLTHLHLHTSSPYLQDTSARQPYSSSRHHPLSHFISLLRIFISLDPYTLHSQDCAATCIFTSPARPSRLVAAPDTPCSTPLFPLPRGILGQFSFTSSPSGVRPHRRYHLRRRLKPVCNTSSATASPPPPAHWPLNTCPLFLPPHHSPPCVQLHVTT